MNANEQVWQKGSRQVLFRENHGNVIPVTAFDLKKKHGWMPPEQWEAKGWKRIK